MSLGLHEAARRLGRRLQVRLAVDTDQAAIEIYTDNLPVRDARADDVTSLFDGKLGAAPTKAEAKIKAKVGRSTYCSGAPRIGSVKRSTSSPLATTSRAGPVFTVTGSIG